jgi:hypothetical protein
MNRFFSFVLCFCLTTPLWAQEGQSAFEYLLVPHSARASALGGTNVSLIENDASLIYDNPAFLGFEMDKTLQLSYLSYVGDVGMGNVLFTKAINERSSWGAGVLFAHYGEMYETTADNIVLGEMPATDLCATVFVAHDLSERWRGGIAGKFLYSNYAHNTAIGLGVDLGLSYYNEDKGFSFGLAGKNIGRQVKAYNEELAKLPWDIQAGITFKPEKAPFRFSLTAVRLHRWKFDDLYSADDSFFKTLGKHLILGVDVVPTDNFWIGIGYNIKRGMDMHLAEGNKFGGLSAGAGLKVKRFNVGVAVGKYNTAATSFMFSIATSFAENSL